MFQGVYMNNILLATVWGLAGIGLIAFITYKKNKTSLRELPLAIYKVIASVMPTGLMGMTLFYYFDNGFSMQYYNFYASLCFAFVLIDTILYRFNVASFTLFHFFKPGLNLLGKSLSALALVSYLSLSYFFIIHRTFDTIPTQPKILFMLSLLIFSQSLFYLQNKENKKVGVNVFEG